MRLEDADQDLHVAAAILIIRKLSWKFAGMMPAQAVA
jgi:hypothetical protein